ncbi:ClpX C4-type zinc finger protein [Lentzea flaviverrucosa]|uniref:ClpX C4-type zinc finger n=1 Tax=Lentzea flaviverrucosa TaxID=200379 RepID=A0A1H9KFJ3_9PSEU|nr:ClpX C4-type zinc finger protein [Lentzea flaviverrucosa]RDI17857.1 ClpX C4-type zinc finger protein [Lentzea flaviverrucosa]SEQ97848.1 ClpX C4-type zinc finger [Lentzea flaviverrucosa]
MSLDQELLAAARTASSASAAAQSQADIAKAVCHHTVLRLHRAGGAMREIAEALQISHQRVHQIVEQPKRTERCWFCGCGVGDDGRLMAGPAALICDLCVAEGQTGEVGDCSFCSETEPVHEGADATICRSCLDFGAAVISGAASPR